MQMVLVDAYSQIFRGFYAIPNLSNSKGEPTNAIYAFAKLLLTLDKEFDSSIGAMAFDCGKVEFRLELLPEYKGNRKPTPPELLAQIPVIRELANAFGWPIVEKNNYEADDLIAGACLKFSYCDISIISSDKDLAQLVNATTTLLRPAKAAGFDRWGEAEVIEGFGVKPEQIIDYLAMLGDTADNILGVAGVGKKTAANILNEAGSLDAFYQDPSLIKSDKIRNKLLDNQELLARNYKLVLLRSDLPEELNPSGVWQRQRPNWSQIREICERMELKSILRELPNPDEMYTQDLFA